MLSPQNNAANELTRTYDSGDSCQSSDSAIGDNDDGNSESDTCDKDRIAFERCVNAPNKMAGIGENGQHIDSIQRPIRPTSIFTKPNGTDCDDIPDGFSRKSIRLNRLDSRNLNGINIKFEQIVYKSQGKFCWNRGELIQIVITTEFFFCVAAYNKSEQKCAILMCVLQFA